MIALVVIALGSSSCKDLLGIHDSIEVAEMDTAHVQDTGGADTPETVGLSDADTGASLPDTLTEENHLDGGASAGDAAVANGGPCATCDDCQSGFCDPMTSMCAPGFTVLYECAPASGSCVPSLQGWIRPWSKIVSRGCKSVDTSTLSLRYWFQEAPTETYGAQQACDNCGVGGVPTISFAHGVVTPARDRATAYYDFHLGAGMIAPDSATPEFQLRFTSDPPGVATHNQENDYSFLATASTLTPSSTVTLYQNGVLVSGIEPLPLAH